ncbi:MAG: c-type cytochrome [Rubrivivax sp.]|jgi:cytochrome c553|nr:cytochrome c4 [Rubrivivax sp.]
MSKPQVFAALALAAALAPPLVSAQTIVGRAAEGEKAAASCIGCHGIVGYQSSFPEVHRVPKISGQNAKYIVASLAAYKKGDRRHPTMRAIAGSMSEQQMADLAAYYEQHGRDSIKTVAETPARQPSAEVAALLTKGACISCHGANFNKPIDPSYPKIGGQFDEYLFVALKSYKVEGNTNVGRAHPVMSAQVKNFSNAELKAMSKYIGSLPSELRTIPQPKFR